MPERKFQPSLPSKTVRRLREAVLKPVGVLFPSNVIEVGDGFSEANALLLQGTGVIIAINHFSERDPVQVLKDIVFSSQVMRRRPLLAPVSYHQKDIIVRAGGALFSLETRGVVNQSTIDKEKNKGHRLGYGLNEYVRDGIEVLRAGGVMLVAPQAERSEELGKPKRAMEFFMRQAERKHLDDYAFLLVGLGIEGKVNYSSDNVGGFNPFRRYEVRIGPTYTRKDLLQEAQVAKMSVDEFIFSKLSQLVPVEYLGDSWRL